MPNESLIHADIFFFISTISLVVISIGISISFFYVIKILRNVRDITDKANRESDELITDLRHLRKALRDEGLKWRAVADLIRGFFTKKSSPSKSESSPTRSVRKKDIIDGLKDIK